jgi:hypothetical protein
VRAWADPTDPRSPSNDVVDRLRLAHQAASLLGQKDSATVIQAWFQGRNPHLDDVAPARLIRESDRTWPPPVSSQLHAPSERAPRAHGSGRRVMADECGKPSTLVASIDDDATGRWQITTETGSTHVVDLVERVITRVPELRTLRRDHEPLLLHRVLDARLGDTGCFLVQVRSDNLPTLRLTSHIVGIAKIRATGDRPPEC